MSHVCEGSETQRPKSDVCAARRFRPDHVGRFGSGRASLWYSHKDTAHLHLSSHVLHSFVLHRLQHECVAVCCRIWSLL